eukprot:6928393-Pyramimonas_sp.AAC.1
MCASDASCHALNLNELTEARAPLTIVRELPAGRDRKVVRRATCDEDEAIRVTHIAVSVLHYGPFFNSHNQGAL